MLPNEGWCCWPGFGSGGFATAFYLIGHSTTRRYAHDERLRVGRWLGTLFRTDPALWSPRVQTQAFS